MRPYGAGNTGDAVEHKLAARLHQARARVKAEEATGDNRGVGRGHDRSPVSAMTGDAGEALEGRIGETA